MAGVALGNVSKQYAHHRGSVEILRNVSITVEDGEFVSLVGRSGCGKTTLLRIVGGFVRPDAGSVLVDATPVRGPGSDRGVLFQQPMLFPWLTVLENTLFGPRAEGSYAADTRERAVELLRVVGLAGFEYHYPKQLSGGMMHRAAFARAMMVNPKIMLMDEPFGALDALTRAGMQQFLLELWERRRFTVILVTHDVEEAVLLSDRVAVMASAPGELVETIEIPLPRPRTYDVSESTEFVDLKRRVRQAVERARGGGSVVGADHARASG
ncbi:MAG: ABC transporter ATP-binding protein [Rhodospirillales bacterium]|nr:ABC transporter ATP-binding protein [Rhodospirillales bacterium]